MPEASELRVILKAAEQLRQELGDRAGSGTASAQAPAEIDIPEPGWPTDAADGRLSARLSRTLGEIAHAAGRADLETEETAERLAAALARTRLVMRGELMRGQAAALRDQMPGFVFLVVLPTGGMDRALELAKRMTALLDEALAS